MVRVSHVVRELLNLVRATEVQSASCLENGELAALDTLGKEDRVDSVVQRQGTTNDDPKLLKAELLQATSEELRRDAASMELKLRVRHSKVLLTCDSRFGWEWIGI